MFHLAIPKTGPITAYMEDFDQVYLSTSIRKTQDIGLAKVAMRRQNHDIEHHRNPSKKRLQDRRIRCLEYVQKEMHHF